MFLTIADFSKSLYTEVRDKLARFDEEMLLEHSMSAEQEIETYLAQRYLIRPELEKEGAARHRLLLQIARNIAIYNLYGVAETIPTIRVKRYEDSVRILDDIAKGKSILTGVPSAPTPDPGTPAGDQIGYGSRPPRAPLFA